MLSDAQWALLEPLIEACRPKGKTQPQDLSDPLAASEQSQVAGCSDQGNRLNGHAWFRMMA
jgi:hypothetical protein